MFNSRTIVLALVALAAVAGTGSIASQAAEPTYAGRTVTHWIAGLQAPDKHARRQAAYALGQIGPEAATAVSALAEAADDNQLEVGWYALDALGRIGPAASPAVPDIVRIVKASQKYKLLQISGVTALGSIGAKDRATIAVLEESLKSSDPVYRVTAALALWRIDRRASAVSALAAELRGESTPAVFAAAMALQEVGPAALSAHRELVRALGHADADVQRAAGRVLGGLGLPVLDLLPRALDFPDRFDRNSVIHALGWVGETVRRQSLQNPQTEAAERQAVADEVQQKVLAKLAPLLADKNQSDRLAAARALVRYGWISLPILLEALPSAESATAAAARTALVELERYLPAGPDARQALPAAITQPLVDLLASRDREVRYASFRLFDVLAITQGDDRTRAALRNGSRDEDARIRHHAARSLKRLTGGG